LIAAIKSTLTPFSLPPMAVRPRPAWPNGCIDHHDRHDGEGRAEEHHLADRISRAEIAHQRRHDGKDQRRGDLEGDGLGDVGGVHGLGVRSGDDEAVGSESRGTLVRD
jgi:hypothetical protein